MEDIIGIRRDMTIMSTQSSCGNSKAQKSAVEYVSQQKGTQTKETQRYRSSLKIFHGTRRRKAMEVYDEIASWDSICESERENDNITRS
jgi:hypothetical protein